MTKNQADWAMQHDWARGYYRTGRALAVDFSVIGRVDTGETGDTDYFGEPVRLFTDFQALRAWAGY